MTDRPLELSAIAARVSQAELLLEHQAYAPAILLIWTAMEALFRTGARDNDLEVGSYGPAQILKQLTMYGVVDESMYVQLQKMLEVRNRVVHGLDVQPLSASDVRNSLALARELLQAAMRRSGDADTA